MNGFRTKFLPLLIFLCLFTLWALPLAAKEPVGQIQGQVRFVGNVPPPVEIPVTKDKEVCGLSKPSEALIVSSGNIQNVVVSLEDLPPEGAAGTAPGSARLEHKDCLFSPHVLVVAKGTTLVTSNSDLILHTAHLALMEISWASAMGSRLKDPHSQASHRGVLFNLSLPVQGQEIRRVLAKPGLFHVMCDIHDWMSAYILVMEHPFFAVTDAEGRFQIGHVPAGKYKIRAWHETLGVKEKEVEVIQGKELRVDFEFALSPESKPTEPHGH